MASVDEFLKRCREEKGYIEKSRTAYDLYGNNCLWDKVKYGGSDNYTKYAVIANHPNGEPWCQTFVAALLVQTFGADLANKLLCGKLASASTMEVKNAMVKAGREVPLAEALPGDIVYRSRSGGGHVGVCDGWKDGKIVTIEGNSSDADLQSWNGGMVVEHIGATWQWAVRPDWNLIGWHWLRDNGIWYYQNADGLNSYGWKQIKETGGSKSHWYYFNKKGQMLTGMQLIEGQWFALMPEGPLEGACCKTDGSCGCYVWDL